MEQAKISDVIKSLQRLQSEVGDLTVAVSIDPEGNDFNYFGKAMAFDTVGEFILLFPDGAIDELSE